MMRFETLEFETDGAVGKLVLNRPERLNAINSVMLEELNAFFSRAQDLDCRVLIMTGKGERGFCTGLDLKEASDPEGGLLSGGFGGDSLYTKQQKFSGIIRAMRECPQPVIAAVNGAAMGAGLSLALAADVRLASTGAIFCASYINIGLGGADMGSSYLLWRLVGWGRAAELLLTGRIIDAGEAYRIGLANHVYPPEELMMRAEEMAREMASKSPLGLKLTKVALNTGLNAGSLQDAISMEDRNQVLLMQDLVIRGGGITRPPTYKPSDAGVDEA